MDGLLLKVATACPHLTEVRIMASSSHLGCVTDVGLVVLAELRKLKRVEVHRSQDVTKVGVTALALNWSVDAIRTLGCARFKWPDAQGIMSMVERPCLDIKVT